MQTRTRHFVAYFSAPFRLSGFERVLPAGAYALDQQEEEIVGASCAAYRRIATFMHLPAVSEGRWTLRLVRVDPSEIETAILHDLKQGSDPFDIAHWDGGS